MRQPMFHKEIIPKRARVSFHRVQHYRMRGIRHCQQSPRGGFAGKLVHAFNQLQNENAGDHTDRNADGQHDRILQRLFPSPLRCRHKSFLRQPFGDFCRGWNRFDQSRQRAIECALIRELVGFAHAKNSRSHPAVVDAFVIERRALHEHALTTREARHFHACSSKGCSCGKVAFNQA
jgi:hypothetical protein